MSTLDREQVARAMDDKVTLLIGEVRAAWNARLYEKVAMIARKIDAVAAVTGMVRDDVLPELIMESLFRFSAPDRDVMPPEALAWFATAWAEKHKRPVDSVISGDALAVASRVSE